ncbi:MAG: hypothetical protein JST89_15440 [Cyanobacteria bacterium SZAS-4]|nr:hypothetical protein [Cyanobacteria bacterium SZAS-4]
MNAITWLLKIAGSMMLVGTVIVDVLLLIAWQGYGFIEEARSKFPLWVILVGSLISFLNFLISSFLFGVSKQVATNRGADMKELPLGEKLSDTIDEGWSLSLAIGKWTFLVVSVLLAGTIAFFFNDLKFLIGFHKGMELNQYASPKEAQKWFRLSMEAAGPDRIAIARFLYAGSLIHDRSYTEAEAELEHVLKELDEKNEEHQALLVYVYSALSNCYMYQNKLDQSELWTNKAIKLIEDHPQMLGLRFRLIGFYKQFLIPEPPPLAVALSGLNDIYALEKKPDLALETYRRILKALEKQQDLTESGIFYELDRFDNQLARLSKGEIDKPKETAFAESAELAKRKCKVKDVAQFTKDFSDYETNLHLKH